MNIKEKAAVVPFNGAYFQQTQKNITPPEPLNLPTVTQEQADIRDKTEPTFFKEVLPAAFAGSNLTAGALDWLDNKHTLDSNYNAEEGFKEVSKDIPEEYWKYFTGNSLEEDRRTRTEVQQRMQHDEVLRKSSGLSYVGAEAAAMLLDPLGVAMFATEAKLLSGMLTKGARGMNAVLHGGASATTGIAYEQALHSVHGTTMDAESVLYTAAGFGLFGAAAGALSKGTVKLNTTARKLSKDMQAGMDKELVGSVAVQHEPMSYAEALSKAGDEPLPEFPRMNKAQQEVRLQARTQEILQENAKTLSKPAKPVALDPEVVLNSSDGSYGMFKQARERIAASWDRVAKGDGSTLGMFVPFQGAEKAGVERVATEVADEASILAEHAVREGASASLKYTEHARQLRKAGAFDAVEQTAVGKAQTAPGRFSPSDSSFVYSTKSDEAKAFAHDIMENGTGTILNPGNAAIKKQAIESRMLSIAQPEFKAYKDTFWQGYTKDMTFSQRMKTWLKGDWHEAMDKELRIEMEMRTNAHAKGVEHASPFSEATQKMADTLDHANSLAVDEMVRHGVHLADEIVKRKGYVQLLWQGRAMRMAMKTSKALSDKYKQAYAESVAEVTGMPIKDAQQISKQVWLRAITNDLGLDANPHALLSRDSREYFRGMLTNNGNMSSADIDSLLARIDATMADSGASARVKRRTGVDLLKTFEHEGKQYQLLDLVDNDMQALHQRYVGEVAGRSALGAKEIAAESDWTALRTAVLEGMGRAGDSPESIEHMKKVIAGTYDQLLSRPVAGGVDRNARRLMNLTGLSLLGQMGMPQLVEFGQVIGAHGIRNMWETMPSLKAFRKSILDGTVDGGVLNEFAVYGGRLWDEHMLFPKKVRLEDKLGSDAGWLKQLDRLTASASEFSGWVSGMYSIKRYQQQWTVLMQTDKMTKALQGMQFTENGYKLTGKFKGQEARLEKLGWDAAFFKRLKDMEQHFEFKDGVINRLNMQKWHDPLLIDQFVEGVHAHTAQIIQRGLIGESHVWMHSTVGALLTQLRSYPIIGIEKQTMRGLHFKDSTSYLTALYGLGLSSLVQAAKAGLGAQGKSDKDKRDYLKRHFSTDGMFKGALAYSSSVSVLPDLLNTAGAFIPGMQKLRSTQATRMGGTRGLNPSMSDVPALGFAVNLANSAGALTRSLDPDYKISKQDTRAMRGIIPLGTAHGAVQFLNIMDDYVRD